MDGTSEAKAPPKFKVGDVVRVASGGPAMTVAGERDEEGDYTCYWFDRLNLETWGTDLRDSYFNEAVLRPSEPDK
jgi:uncharacterized protein YodC (DUF2158 family)